VVQRYEGIWLHQALMLTVRRSWIGCATKSNCSGGVHYANRANAIGSTGAIWPCVNGSNYRCRLGGRYTQWSDHSRSVKALWGAHCGKSARCGPDVFVHISAVEKAGYTGLAEGAKVSYELVTGRTGKASAEHLRIG
jgi:cold shock CspA family protein